ncbi:unnamed protein product, partial [Oppiella nova]
MSSSQESSSAAKTSMEVPPSDQQYDHLLLELESSDTNTVAHVLRAIYDGDEHQKFMDKLDARIKNHDKDIERMCNCHYQGFVDCI